MQFAMIVPLLAVVAQTHSIELGGIIAIQAPLVVPLVPQGPNCRGTCSVVAVIAASTFPYEKETSPAIATWPLPSIPGPCVAGIRNIPISLPAVLVPLYIES